MKYHNGDVIIQELQNLGYGPAWMGNIWYSANDGIYCEFKKMCIVIYYEESLKCFEVSCIYNGNYKDKLELNFNDIAEIIGFAVVMRKYADNDQLWAIYRHNMEMEKILNKLN